MRKGKCIIVICIIICSFAICVYAENITDLQEQSNELSEQLNETTNRLQVVHDELSEHMQQLQEIDQQIAMSQEELEEINAELENLSSRINENEQKLKKAQKEHDDMQELLNSRLIAIYKSSKLQNLEILLKSKNISDFIANYYALKQLIEYDTKLLEIAKKQKEEIETTQNTLSEEKNQIVVNKQLQQKKSQVLDNNKTIREYYINKLTKEELELQNKIDEYNLQVSEIEAEIKLLALNSISEDYIGGAMIWPIPGYETITSQYGMREHPITGAYKLHTGIDVGAPLGANFVAAANGIVTKATFNTAYGNMVIVDHGGGIQTLYAHGSEIMVQVGQTVKTGDEVLKVGTTGYSTGPHAHFEIRINGKTLNPLDYLVNNKSKLNTTSENNN